MKASSEERDKRLKEIFEKNEITSFWEAYQMLTQEAGCTDLISFEDCIIHFGDDKVFHNISSAKLYYDKHGKHMLSVKYKMNDIHPKLKGLVEFCKKQDIDWSDIDGASETISVEFEHKIILKYVQAEAKKAFGKELPKEAWSGKLPQSTKTRPVPGGWAQTDLDEDCNDYEVDDEFVPEDAVAPRPQWATPNSAAQAIDDWRRQYAGINDNPDGIGHPDGYFTMDDDIIRQLTRAADALNNGTLKSPSANLQVETIRRLLGR